MQGRMIGDKILASLLSQIRYKHLMRITDPYRKVFLSHLVLIKAFKVVGDATFIHLTVASRPAFSVEEEEETKTE